MARKQPPPPSSPQPPPRLTGWVPRPADSARAAARIRNLLPSLARDGEGRGRTVCLHTIWQRAADRAFPVWTQGIGDCVGQGWALALTVLLGVRAARRRQDDLPTLDVASEPIYAGSRVEIGQRQVGRDDGSVGAWAARWVVEYGVLYRLPYHGQGVDLSTYSPRLARQWGWDGVPDPLEPIARQRPIGTAQLVTSYEQARDWIATTQGPVVACSDQGFDDRRDAQGFAKPQGTWNHCMCFVAVDDSGRRPGLLCCNSWGPSWISGPTRLDQPPGSFWVEADVADRMLAQNDSFGVSDLTPVDPTPDVSAWVMY